MATPRLLVEGQVTAIQLKGPRNQGLPLARAELNLLNNQWRYPGNGDYRGLFRSLPIDDSIRNRVDQVPHWLAAAQQALAGAMPVRATGKHCAKPYPCPFLDHCRGLDPPMPAHPLELLPGTAGRNLARKLRETRGYVSLLEPVPTELTGNDAALYRRMQRAHRRGGARGGQRVQTLAATVSPLLPGFRGDRSARAALGRRAAV